MFIGYCVVVALTDLTVAYNVIIALTGLLIRYSVIVALIGLPLRYSLIHSIIIALTGLPDVLVALLEVIQRFLIFLL